MEKNRFAGCWLLLRVQNIFKILYGIRFRISIASTDVGEVVRLQPTEIIV